ncbi:unnamed protein product [Pocillopora meandrina]|uniref:Receptor protein-tyrosine kinase n=1 Tax=Pocillopora meandrina TaxID=46732 RepID=A0AAU9VQQ5_9CNID|nr:unnamed protein product [Pocillopora meandrina]
MVRIPLLNNASLFAVPGCQYIDVGIGNGYTLDRDFSSSSVLNANTPAKNGRLNYNGGSSWCAATSDSQPYLQVDFEKLYIVCAVSTQGNSQGDEWVRKYSLQSSRDGTTWTDYQEAGTLKVFSGNFNRNKTVKQILCSELVAKRLRFIPKEHYGNCCMRVEIYGIPLTADNLALGKPARQSSIFLAAMDVNYPRRAVDGVKNTNRYYCASTGAPLPDPYWRVDLEQVLPVSEVFILNSGDCCGEHLNGTEIRVGNETRDRGGTNDLCTSDLRVPQGKGKFLRCNMTLYGRYLFIRIPGSSKVLVLCEVEVFSAIRSNLALYQSASQSSTRSNYTANKAVDGDVHSCATTQSQQDPWWRVDLGASRVVAKVIVTYKNQMEGLQVWIGYDSDNRRSSNLLCGGKSFSKTVQNISQRLTIHCLPRLVGNFVFIEDSGANRTLSLCEVQVYSERETSNACQTQAVNLANSNIHLDKRFTASSFLANNEPYKARLRNTLGAWLPSSNNNTNDYLEVELGDVFFICAVATQGHPLRRQWTKSYKLHLFLRNWITYKENNSEKIFSGGRSSQNEIVKQFLAEVTRARIIRFQPVNYHIHKVLRVEVYGTKTPAASPVHPVIKNKEKEIFHNSSIKWNSPDANGCPVSMFSVYYKAIKSRNKESAWHHINTSSDANELSCSSLPLECGTDYEFKVSAWNDVGESNLSESWQVKSITGYPAIVNRTNQVNGSVVVVRWKPCTASLFTIYHREMLSEGKSHWKAVNVSRHETSYDLHLGCQKEHEIAVTAWNSSAETPLTSILKHGRLWRVRTFGDKPSPPIIKSKEVQMSGCDVNLKWGSTQDNGCPLTMYTVYYREVQSLGEDEYWHHINVTMDSTSTSLTSLKCNSEYTFKVTAWNELGESNTSKEWRIKTAQITDISRGRTLSIAVFVGCGLLILLTVGILYFMIRQRRKKRNIRVHKTRRSMSDIVPLLLKEIPPERVTIMEELGRGAFGKVHKAILKEMPRVEVFFKPKEEREDHIKEGRVVAVKLLHERAGEEGQEQFVREISFMQRVGTHRNVLSMVGY